MGMESHSRPKLTQSVAKHDKIWQWKAAWEKAAKGLLAFKQLKTLSQIAEQS
jgi:hypothetical protein